MAIVSFELIWGLWCVIDMVGGEGQLLNVALPYIKHMQVDMLCMLTIMVCKDLQACMTKMPVSEYLLALR